MGEMGQLPTGTVTFLFTDIEGSTRRWQDHVSMSAVLARHDEILREAVDAQDGRLLKHTGDGAMAVFASAVDGLVAAVEAQREFGAEQWPGDPLKVRMAVHTGEAELRDGDYFGTAPTVAARLMGAAHGGQVLVSLASEEVVRDRMPQGISLVDLGRHRLRDVDRPERVFQVVGQGLEEGFTPLSGEVEVAAGLPQPRTSFVGREADIAQLLDLIAERRLVTLVGVGGAGKTRLAVEVAWRVVRESPEPFGGGVYLADLSSLSDPSGIARAVAEALGMPPVQGPTGTVAAGSTEDRVVAFLRGRQVLLVVDNCEHLLDPCAGFVDRLLSAAPGLTVLATSREALAVQGEQAWQVRSLSLPDGQSDDDGEAMRLLVDRIRAVRPDFEVDASNRGALAEICVRLDGIPLALELAAARAVHLAPGEIAGRLNDRFDLLAGGRRRVQRQQTLQATVDWSYDLLDADEQALLRRLAVFSGGFGLQAATDVCMDGLDASAVDLLGSLVDKSLVVADTVDGRTRYRLLETIRLYAEDKLASAGEAQRIRSAHRDWFLQRVEAERWDRCLLSESLASELNRDYDNLRAALDWCLTQDRPDLLRRLLLRVSAVIYRYGRFDEAQPWFDRVLEHERTLPRDQWFAHVVAEWADTWRFVNEVDEVEGSLSRIAELAEHLPDGSPAAALAHSTQAGMLAVFPRRAPDIERAGGLIAEQAGTAYPLWRAWGLWIKAIALLYQRRYDDAERLLDELCRSPDWDTDTEAGYLKSTLAFVWHLQERHNEALELLESVRWSFDADRLQLATATALSTAALGDLAAARQQMRDTVTSVRTAGWEYPLVRSDCLVGLAGLAALEGEPERSSRLVAAVPGMVTATPLLWVLLRHYRDLVRDQLDRETRRRCIEQGRATGVDDAIDSELARWDGQEQPPARGPGTAMSAPT